jgi:hypothetical protein
VILLGVEVNEITDLRCARLEEVARVRNVWGVPGERDVPIVICRNPAVTLRDIWAREGPHWG